MEELMELPVLSIYNDMLTGNNYVIQMTLQMNLEFKVTRQMFKPEHTDDNLFKCSSIFDLSWANDEVSKSVSPESEWDCSIWLRAPMTRLFDQAMSATFTARSQSAGAQKCALEKGKYILIIIIVCHLGASPHFAVAGLSHSRAVRNPRPNSVATVASGGTWFWFDEKYTDIV